MTKPQKLIEFLDEKMAIGGRVMRIVIFKDDDIALLIEIKGILENLSDIILDYESSMRLIDAIVEKDSQNSEKKSTEKKR